MAFKDADLEGVGTVHGLAEARHSLGLILLPPLQSFLVPSFSSVAHVFCMSPSTLIQVRTNNFADPPPFGMAKSSPLLFIRKSFLFHCDSIHGRVFIIEFYLNKKKLHGQRSNYKLVV